MKRRPLAIKNVSSILFSFPNMIVDVTVRQADFQPQEIVIDGFSIDTERWRLQRCIRLFQRTSRTGGQI